MESSYSLSAVCGLRTALPAGFRSSHTLQTKRPLATVRAAQRTWEWEKMPGQEGFSKLFLNLEKGEISLREEYTFSPLALINTLLSHRSYESRLSSLKP